MTRPDLLCDVCTAEIRVDEVAVSLGDQGWAHEGCVELGDVVMRSHYSADGSVETIEVLQAPRLSCVSPEFLDQVDPKWRDPDDPDVLVLPGGYRYRVGGPAPDRYRAAHDVRLLRRIDELPS